MVGFDPIAVTVCGVNCLFVEYSPLRVRGENIRTVAMGFGVMFPFLASFEGGGQWEMVQAALR